MVTFQFVSSAVFLKCFICHSAFNIECIRITVEPVQIEFIPENFLPQFILKHLAGFLIMLKQQILHCVRIIGVMTFYVFDNCQNNHLPIEALLSAAHKVLQLHVLFPPAWQESVPRHC